MLKDQIVVGKAYVNERTHVLREVVEEIEEERVKFNAFDLATGRLLPSRHRVLPARDMAAWAGREASSAELARIHPYAPEALQEPVARTSVRGIEIEAAKAALDASPGYRNMFQAK